MHRKNYEKEKENWILSNDELDMLLELLNRLKRSQVSSDIYRTSKSLFILVCELRFKTTDTPIIEID